MLTAVTNILCFTPESYLAKPGPSLQASHFGVQYTSPLLKPSARLGQRVLGVISPIRIPSQWAARFRPESGKVNSSISCRSRPYPDELLEISNYRHPIIRIVGQPPNANANEVGWVEKGKISGRGFISDDASV